MEYIGDVYAPKGEVVSSWLLPADDVAAPSAVVGGWPLTLYTALGTTKGPENCPPRGHTAILPLFFYNSNGPVWVQVKH